MTSFRQTEANRRNAGKSTGPITEGGKQRSRCNAVRHGLTAETVIGSLEDAGDYKAFEAAITAHYDAQSAGERELVLQLASLLCRLRRATTMETGWLVIQADHLREFRQDCLFSPVLWRKRHKRSNRELPSLRTRKSPGGGPGLSLERTPCKPCREAHGKPNSSSDSENRQWPEIRTVTTLRRTVRGPRHRIISLLPSPTSRLR